MFCKNKFIHRPSCTTNTACLGTSSSKSRQLGRSMIEMLGVLAIVGILSAGGIAGYSMAMQNHKTNALIEKVQIMAQRVQELYPDRDYNAELGSDTLINAGFISDKNHPFGGTLSIWDGTLSDGSGCFAIVANGSNIPADACVKILTTYWGDSGVFWGVGTNSAQNRAFSYENNNYPVSTQNAISACKGGNKMIKWWFK